MTKVQKDYILLDRSGSMADKWQETISSINVYVHELADKSVDTEVSLTVFDNYQGLQFETIRTNQKPKEWKNVDANELRPRGSTPLYDSINLLVQQAEKDNPEKAAIIVMTDGMENCSTEIDKTKAKALLDQCKAKGWSVVFLGADFDAMAQSGAVGVGVGQTLNMTHGNYSTAFSGLATTRAMYASGMAATMSFSDEDRKKATGKDTVAP